MRQLLQWAPDSGDRAEGGSHCLGHPAGKGGQCRDLTRMSPSSISCRPQVDVQFVRLMKRFIPLAELKTHHHAHKATGGPLSNLALFTRQRLSIQPLTPGKSGRC